MNRFREVRESLKMSQKEVALTLGVSAPTVSEWEKGKKNPNTSNLKELARLYGVSIDYLLGNSSKEEPVSAEKVESLSDDEVSRELEALIDTLSDDEKSMMVAMIRALIDRRSGDKK